MKLITILGDGPRIKILDFFITDSKNTGFNVTEISNYSGVSRPTVYKELKKLLNLNIVTHDKKVKGKKTYKFNNENKLSKLLINFLSSL